MKIKNYEENNMIGFIKVLKAKPLKVFIATFSSGLGMWIVGGLWHNLILPKINDNATAHHEGLGIALIAYFILGFIMSYLYIQSNKKGNIVLEGARIGIIVGILWVFPHGLVMAGAHDSSIIYEIKNTIYHMFEQGIGGIIISAIIHSTGNNIK